MRLRRRRNGLGESVLQYRRFNEPRLIRVKVAEALYVPRYRYVLRAKRMCRVNDHIG